MARMGAAVEPKVDWDWREARRRCLALALRLLRSRDDAEDAVQEAFMRGFRHARSCRDWQDPVPWLMTITRRECARVARRRVEREVAALEACGEYGDGHDSSKDVASTIDLRMAITHLSEEDRLIFGLRHVRHMTQPEVARVTGLPEGTVKTRLHRIRARIRSKMEVS